MVARRRIKVHTPEENHPRMTAPHASDAYLILWDRPTHPTMHRHRTESCRIRPRGGSPRLTQIRLCQETPFPADDAARVMRYSLQGGGLQNR